jgi:hypothetical protein
MSKKFKKIEMKIEMDKVDVAKEKKKLQKVAALKSYNATGSDHPGDDLDQEVDLDQGVDLLDHGFKNNSNKVIEEVVTLDSSSDEEEQDHQNGADEVMEVDDNDHGDKKNGDKIEDMDIQEELGKDETTSDLEVKNGHTDDNGHPEAVVKNGNNGITDKKTPTTAQVAPQDEATILDNVIKAVVREVVKLARPPLRPGQVLSKKEAIAMELKPFVSLVKLTGDYSKKKTITDDDEITTETEDRELEVLLNQIQAGYKNVIQLANGISAISLPDGDTVILPPDYKEKVRLRGHCKLLEASCSKRVA